MILVSVAQHDLPRSPLLVPTLAWLLPAVSKGPFTSAQSYFMILFTMNEKTMNIKGIILPSKMAIIKRSSMITITKHQGSILLRWLRQIGLSDLTGVLVTSMLDRGEFCFSEGVESVFHETKCKGVKSGSEKGEV